ncbi:DUF3348 domain-containing protein [Pollutimonas sp. M17]|uniref:DUF3348 domain-containing protein n=1 Tax=Pollutimonas sp. M17 TaxID=2962065 RepID=UPI0021F414CD|nr:DUF3348 domain-containing protein [Pollutimonas sp. M17]UYO92392.1 DUF3348 domain-containing protein [Pollutimonas sp. M17]HWK69914.1 DUF3348 domain-containing protein [Burkholderiaceae bacterium]
MVQELPRRTSSSGPALIRLLARLNEADILEPGPSLPDRLGQWLDWADAIALAAALNGSAPSVEAGGEDPAACAGQSDYDRVKAELQRAIASVNAPPVLRQRAPRAAVVQGGLKAAEAAEFATYRRRYVSLQQAMEAGITNLRCRLRGKLAAKAPEMAGLAGVDAAMEQALNEREYRLLAGVPALLEARFERLRQTALAAPSQDAPSARSPAADSGAWLDVFDKDMRSVLLAELHIRLQAVEGLLAALRAC